MHNSNSRTRRDLENQNSRDFSGTESEADTCTVSLSEYVLPRFQSLCEAAGFESETEKATSVLADLLEPWGSNTRSLHPEWLSEISDDNTPIEFSVTLGDGQEEVRALLEAQSEEPTVEAHRLAALGLTEKLERDYQADLSRFRAIQDLFLPRHMNGPFALWHSVVFGRNRKPSFKAYLNPAAHGPSNAPRVVEEALRRLGLERAWEALCQSAVTRGPFLDEVKYFALDLAEGPEARVKIYVRHHEATPSDLEATCKAADSYVPGEALEFARAMAGGDQPLFDRAPFTCSSFVGGQSGRPAATTLYVPVCAYAPHDAAVRDRVNEYLDERSPVKDSYNAILEGFANRPLDSGVGLQSWAALRRYRGKERYTVYLATEASRKFAPHEVPAATADRTRFDSARDVVHRALSYRLSDHPYFRSLAEQNDPAPFCTLTLLNLRAALNESRQTETSTSQLIDELFQCFPEQRTIRDQANPFAGRRLGEELKTHLSAESSSERLAARILLDQGAKQIAEAVERLTGRKLGTNRREEPNLEPMLEELDAVGRDDVAGSRRGALLIHRSIWSMLDELYIQSRARTWRSGMSGTHPVNPTDVDEQHASAAPGQGKDRHQAS